MRRYWDASALVDALHDPRVEQKTREPGQWTRLHALVETFATLTGGRLGIQYLPDDAAALVKEVSSNMSFVELDHSEISMALESAQQHGVRGGRVHDWLHACAARKANVAELLTDNLSDYAGLEDGFTVLAP